MGWRPPRTSGNPNRRIPNPKENEKVITWKDPNEGYGLAKREVPARYRNPGTFVSSYKAKLVIGAPMVAKYNFEKIEREQPNYPFPTLRRLTKRQQLCVPKGMLMIYAGTVRVKERARCSGELVDLEVPKHTFIIPHVGRCIIHDLRLVKHA